MLFARSRGKKLSTASIRRACETGAIPRAERHSIGSSRELWLIARQPLIDWITEGMPGRHHYQAVLIRTGQQQLPERLRKTAEYGVCRRCGHHLEPGLTDWPTTDESGELVIVHDTPANICPECGDAIASADVLEQIDRLTTAGGGEISEHLILQYEPPPKEPDAEGNS